MALEINQSNLTVEQKRTAVIGLGLDNLVSIDNNGVATAKQLDGLTLSKLTQAEYDALPIKDDNTLYIILDA